MTFEERIDALTSRHEALAQSVELLVHGIDRLESAQEKTETMLAGVVESINSLARIAHAHEGRITRIEDRT